MIKSYLVIGCLLFGLFSGNVFAAERVDNTHSAANAAHARQVSSEALALTPITLVDQSRLRELDQNRHRLVEEKSVELTPDIEHRSLLITLLGLAAFLVVGVVYMRSRTFTNRSLGFKLSAGFGAIMLLALTIGLGSSYYMQTISDEYHLALEAAELDLLAAEMAAQQNAFVLYGLEDREKGEEIRADVVQLLGKINAGIHQLQGQALKQNERDLLTQISASASAYEQTFGHLVEKFHAIEELKEQLEQAAETMTHELETVIHEHEKELAKLEKQGATGRQLMLQTELLETLFAAEVLELKLAHAEVAFLLDKHLDRVATMEAELTELYATLASARQIIPQLDTSDAEKHADLARLDGVVTQLHQVQELLSEAIIDELETESDLIDLTANFKEIEANGLAFAGLMDQKALAAKADAGTSSTILLIIALLSGSLVSYFMTRSITKPVGEAVEMLGDIENGRLDKRVKQLCQDEIGTMVRTMNRFADSIQSEVVANLQKLANGNLDFDISPRDDRDEFRGALKKLNDDLNDIVSQIQVAGEQIASGSSLVAESSQSLSQGATEQASSLEEISASLNEVTAQIANNAQSAQQASHFAGDAQQAAEKGTSQMRSMVAAMEEINLAGQSISKIIKTIDEIAFQTNLLALNAAVEAARAGQHGKGFAVVAEEVRALAARSADAAEETAELIEGAVEKTANGNSIASQTAQSLQDIYASVNNVSRFVDEIATASNEQAQGLEQISEAVSVIDQVTQLNTANAEESAAAAEQLSGQSEQLRHMLQRFVIKQSKENRLSLDQPDSAG